MEPVHLDVAFHYLMGMAEVATEDASSLQEENARLRQRIAHLERTAHVLRASFDLNPVAQALVNDVDGSYVDVNQAFVNLTGTPRSAILGKTSVQLGLQAEAEARQRAAEQMRTSGVAQGMPFELQHPDGQRHVLLASIRPLVLRDESLLSVTYEDHTEQRQSRDALQEADAQADALLKALPDVLLHIDADGRLHDYRGPAGRLLPDPDASLGQMIEQVLPVDMCVALRKGIAGAMTTGRHRETHFALEQNGARCWYELSIASKGTARSHFVVLVRDITERKQVKERLHAMLSALPDVVFVFSREGSLLELHAPSADQRYSPSEQLLGQGLRAHFPTDVANEYLRNLDATLQSRKIRVFEYELSLHPIEVRRFEARMVPRDDHTVLVLVRDISERMRAAKEKAALEEQLRHAQKMEAIGRLAGGVAHDFNNILGGLLGNLSLLHREAVLGGSVISEHIQEMKELVQRGSDLAKQLLGFSRRGKYDVQPLDLARVLRKVGAMFGRTRPDLNIVFVLGNPLRPVLMDHTQLEQVLLNLLVNAGQAMPDGGTLTLQAEDVTVSDAMAGALNVRPGPFVKLLVQDTGCGMDAPTLERIFEPFFTTKPAGQGTGLGLASVYGIVSNHGGLIAVHSEPGVGSVFTLHLPATLQPVSSTTPAAIVGRTGHGTLLLVDDEASIRKVFALLLQAHGYTVLSAASGHEAIQIVREHDDPIALVILDLTMPGLSGAKTFEVLHDQAPQLKILLVSGHAEDQQARDLLVKGASGFLQKPFDGTALLRKIASIV